MAPRNLLNEISDEVFTMYVMETTNFYDLKDQCGYKPGTVLPHVNKTSHQNTSENDASEFVEEWKEISPPAPQETRNVRKAIHMRVVSL